MPNTLDQPRFTHAALIALALVVAVSARVVLAEPKSSKEIIQKKRIEPEKGRIQPTPPSGKFIVQKKDVVPKKQIRRHIRFALPTDDRHDVDFQAVLSRSTRSLGFSIEYYDDARRRHLEAAIGCFRDNRRDEGYEHWNRFVLSLDTFEKPVDLEPVMYHVLREGCLRQDPNVLFHAERLERVRGDLENIEEYWDDLYRLHNQCQSPGGGCLESVERKIDDELQVLSQERDYARAQVGVAQRALERAQMTGSGEVARSVDGFYTIAQEITRRTEYVLYADND